MAQDEKDQDVNLTAFHGSEDTPDDLESVFHRPWLRPEQEEPNELSFARTHRTVYVPTDDSGEYDIDVSPDEHLDELECVRVSFRVEGRRDLHLLGERATREPPERIVAGADATDVSGHRPDWIPATPYPRPLPQRVRPEMMRRIDGRPVNPLYVFNPEDRLTYMDASWPWGLVGKVFTSDGFTGTGALIGPRLVATAGHLVPWGQPGWWMRFIPAFYDGVSLHGAGVESYVSDARGYDVDGNVTGYDWAVCRLYEPLGSWLGYFGYNGYSSSWNNHPYWVVLGYPSAISAGRRPSWERSISVFDVDSDSNGGKELESRADMTPGNSGGPMFSWWDGDPRLVGVVSGEETDWTPGFWPWEWGGTERGNVVAAGSGFTSLMAWGRTNWP